MVRIYTVTVLLVSSFCQRKGMRVLTATVRRKPGPLFKGGGFPLICERWTAGWRKLFKI